MSGTWFSVYMGIAIRSMLTARWWAVVSPQIKPIIFYLITCCAVNSKGIEQSSDDVLRALIDFQKSLGCLGSRLEKHLLFT